MNLKYITSLLFVLCTTLAAYAEDIFEHYGVRQGLGNRQVYELCTDADGFLWVYTNSGIDRFDGSEFRHYRLPIEEKSRDYIQAGTSLDIDENGNLWVGLKNGSLFRYDRLSDSFVEVLDLRKQGLDVRMYEFNILPERSGVVFATSDGLRVFTPDADVATIAAGEPVYAIHKFGQEYFAGTDRGVGIYTPGVDSLQYVWTKPETHVTKLLMSGKLLLIGTFADGIFVYDTENNTVRRPAGDIPPMPVNAIEIAGDGDILFGVDGAGVFRTDSTASRMVAHYVYDEEIPTSLSANTITALCADSDNGLWIGTSSSGLNHLAGEHRAMTVTAHIPYLQQSLVSDYVNAIFEDSRGNVWYGTDNGLSAHTPDGTWHHFLKGKDYHANVILALEEDADGNIWVGGYGTGTFIVNPDKWTISPVPARNGDTGVGTGHVFDICALGDDVWLGGIEGPLTRFNLRTGKYTYYPYYCVGGMARGDNNELYIAGCSGLGVFHPGDDDITWLSDSAGFHFNYPVSFVVYDSARKEVWLPTDGQGLVRYDPEKQKFSTFMPRTELESASINALVIDREGNMWFCTESDIYRSDSSRNSFRRINPALGIERGTFNPRAGAITTNGLAFGSAEGAITFRPDLEIEDIGGSCLVFNDLSVKYEVMKPGADNPVLPVSLNNVDELKLTYDKNAFEISFSTINFTAPRRIRYEYMLEGYDDEWKHADNGAHTVSYSDIPPGKYTFRVVVFDAFSRKEIDSRALPILISSPWWARWWSILIFCVLGIAVIAGGAKLLIDRRREKRVNEKIQAFVNVAHDIRTPVTLIKAPLSEIQEDPDLPERARRNTGVAMDNVNRLLDMIGQLVDIQRENKHSDDLLLEPCNIRRTVNEKVENFRYTAIHKGLLLKVDIPADFPEMEVDIKKLDHILDNLLSNALKYTNSGEIVVSAALEKKFWALTVSDTGIGIPSKDRKRIFRTQYRAASAAASDEIGSGIGLLITKRLVRLHRGTISFKSTEGVGTSFTVRLPRLEVLEPVPDVHEVPDTEVRVQQSEKPLIFLAEDDPDIRRYLCASLEDDYEIVAADTGEAILEMLANSCPDIILSDVMMPGMGGIELCRRLKSSVETSHVPLILLTALTSRNDIIAGLEAGANDYVVKPFDMSVLRVRIRNILDNRNRLRKQLTSQGEMPADEDYASELDRTFIENVQGIINAHISDSDYSIADVCRELGMSRTSVYNKIKSLTGLSINDYMRVTRLNRAKELLLEHRYTVAEVAYMVGFSDAKYFSTCFKKQFDISPSKI